jgi:hypothetical protein
MKDTLRFRTNCLFKNKTKQKKKKQPAWSMVQETECLPSNSSMTKTVNGYKCISVGLNIIELGQIKIKY